MNIAQTVSRYLEPVTDADAVTVTLSRAAWEELFLSRMNLFLQGQTAAEVQVPIAHLLGLISSGDRTEQLSLKLSRRHAETLYGYAKRAYGMNETLFLECANQLVHALGLHGAALE
jgi:hypothetical protein